MSATGRPIGGAVMIIAVLAYFTLMGISLIVLHMSPITILALTLGAIAFLLLALRPYLGLQAFIMILFLENAIVAKEGITVVKGIGAIIFAGWLLSMAMRKESPIRVDALAVLCLAFLTWCGFALFNAIDASVATGRVLTFVQLAMAAMMFASVVDTPKRMRGVYVALVVWTLVSTCVAIVQYYLGMTPMAVGLIGNRNLLSTYINIGIVCAFLLYQSTAQTEKRIALILILPVLFLGLALTFSRTGLIVQGLALALVWYRVAREKDFFILAGSAAALCLVTLLLPAGFFTRASSIVPAIQRQEDTFGIRVRLWKAGIRMMEDRPLTGVGPGNFFVVVGRYGRGEQVVEGLGAHNAYISVGAETGLIGLAVFVALLLSGLHCARKAVRLAKAAHMKDLENYALMTEICLLVIMAAGLSGTVENLKLLWLILGLCFGLVRMLPRQAAAGTFGKETRDDGVPSLTLAPGGMP